MQTPNEQPSQPNQPPWQNGEPQAVEPQAVEPQAVEPQAVEPQPAQPQYGQSPYGQSSYGQSQPTYPQYGQPQSPLPPAYNDPLPPAGYPQAGPIDNSVNGTTVLVLGLLGLLFCQVLGIVAWVMGNNALKTLDSGRGDESQRQLVVVGRVLGIIATCLMILLALFVIVVFTIAFTAALHAPRPSPVGAPSPFQP